MLCFKDIVTGFLESHLDNLTNIGFVVDNEYAPIAAFTCHKKTRLEFAHDDLFGDGWGEMYFSCRTCKCKVDAETKGVRKPPFQ